MLDGYDEYSEGTNTYIDQAIKSTISKYTLLLTSRPGSYVSVEIRKQMDAEVVIKGLNKNNKAKCSLKYLGNKKHSDAFLAEAKNNRIKKLLHVPIILLMACMVFAENGSLPETQAQLYQTVFKLIIDRTTIKTLGKKSSEIKELGSWLDVLSRMSWEALKRDSLFLDKVTNLVSSVFSKIP